MSPAMFSYVLPSQAHPHQSRKRRIRAYGLSLLLFGAVLLDNPAPVPFPSPGCYFSPSTPRDERDPHGRSFLARFGDERPLQRRCWDLLLY